MNYILADLESAVQYFKDFADNDADAPAFYFGTLDQVIAASRGDDEFHYPCLWLDLPKISTYDNDASNLIETYSFQISCFFSAAADNAPLKAKAYTDSLKILYRLQKHMKHDNAKAMLCFDLSGNHKIPLNAALFNGTHYGYFLDFDAGFFANEFLC
jgi:hypothetical protein